MILIIPYSHYYWVGGPPKLEGARQLATGSSGGLSKVCSPSGHLEY